MPQETGLARQGLEKFYTLDPIAKKCVETLKLNVNIDPEVDIIIEPSAGSGAFLPYLTPLANNVIALDIEPDAPGIIRADFLEYSPPPLTKEGGQVICVGNPPFGRQASLAVRFIQHAAEFADVIAFILPKSFLKASMQSRVPLTFRLAHQYELPQSSFSINNEPYFVPCIFQIWKRSQQKRQRTQITNPQHFSFVTRDNEHDFAIRRVGVKAGAIVAAPQSTECSIQSHYFIKLNDEKDILLNIEKLRNIVFAESEHTVGIKSISKREVVDEFDRILA